MTDGMAIWVFDSHCVLCEGGVQFTLRNERAPTIRFVAITSEEGRSLAQSAGVDPDDPLTFLFIENNQVLEKSDAFIALVGHLKAPASWARIIKCLPRVLRDWAYSLVAHNRYRIFGRKQECNLPSPDQRHRFVL